MNCPKCQALISGHGRPKGGKHANVTDSRRTRNNTIRRRRECLSCGERVTTYEYIAPGPLEKLRDHERLRSELVGLMEKLADLLEASTPEAESRPPPAECRGAVA